MRRPYKWIIIVGGLIALMAAIQMARQFFFEAERKARIRLRKAVLEAYPEAVSALQAQYGLKRFAPSSLERPSPGALRIPVILIHGIDEPGRVWMNLAPDLAAKGHAVWILTYPNDQPVAESAQFFLSQLRTGDLTGTSHIAIVAHSMGGLVTREMLTSPALAFRDKVNAGLLPRVDQLIMVGTPNHGSELARFRGFLEVRDQLRALFQKEYHWLRGFVDGTGEAGIDLIPGSAFLQSLNSRPLPADVRMLNIAGVLSPNQKQSVEAMARSVASKLPGMAPDLQVKMTQWLIAATEKVGDGVVSVDSVGLPGVPLVTVPGTHLSIIRNLTAESRRVPPAIPIIIAQF